MTENGTVLKADFCLQVVYWPHRFGCRPGGLHWVLAVIFQSKHRRYVCIDARWVPLMLSTCKEAVVIWSFDSGFQWYLASWSALVNLTLIDWWLAWSAPGIQRLANLVPGGSRGRGEWFMPLWDTFSSRLCFPSGGATSSLTPFYFATREQVGWYVSAVGLSKL